MRSSSFGSLALFIVASSAPSAHPPTGMHDAGMHETGSQAAGMHATGMHDGACACALFSVTVASIAGAIYAVALRKWRRARSSSFVSPPSVIAARYRKSNSHATRLELPATEFRRTRDRFAPPGRSAKWLRSLAFSGGPVWSPGNSLPPRTPYPKAKGGGIGTGTAWFELDAVPASTMEVGLLRSPSSWSTSGRRA